MMRHSATGCHRTWVPVVHWSDHQNYILLEPQASMYDWSKSNHKLDKVVGSIWGRGGSKPPQVF